MKIERIFTYCLLAGTFLLASCGNEATGVDSGDNSLPEGKYPVTFTATGLQATAVTRATADDTWKQGDEVAVQIGSDVRKYTTADGIGASTTLRAADGVSPFYWKNTDNIDVTAWYFGTGYDTDVPLLKTWSVKDNQNISDNYQCSDFLYAHNSIDFKGTQPLAFYHQTAKVVVNITSSDVGTDDIASVNIQDVKIQGNYTPPVSGSGSTSGTWSNLNTKATITMYRKSVTSYAALVIPQTISQDERLFEITVSGYAPFYYIVPSDGITWSPGTEYTYNLTVNGSEVTATVTSSIGWTDGATGSGSVEIS